METKGKLFNRSFIIRKRKFKTRYGVSSGKCFYNFQFHKYGFYFEKKEPLKSVNFNNIKDLYVTKRIVVKQHIEQVG